MRIYETTGEPIDSLVGSEIILCKPLRLMIKIFFQRAFSIYADIRKLQDKVQISYTLSTLKNLLPSINYTCRQKKN